MAALLAVLIAGCQPAGGRSAAAVLAPGEREYESVQFVSALVMANEHFPTFEHNVIRLRGRLASGAGFEADFLGFFSSTGGSERWGRPISEVFEENPGVLVQYFENGVLDYRPPFGVEPRSVSKLMVGDGVEVRPISRAPGEHVGPWGRQVSNLSVEGLETGFLDMFRDMGGVASFGYPRSDARDDDHPEATMASLPTVDGAIRQYFEAGVLQILGGSDQAPSIIPLGRALRDQVYPGREWMDIPAFMRTERLQAPATYPDSYLGDPEATVGEVVDSVGVLVSRVGHPYALAYHPQHHLLFRPGDGWYALFFEANDGVLAYSRDGAAFSPGQAVAQGPIATGLSLYQLGGKLYLLYTDSNETKVYLQPVTASGGAVQAAEPILVRAGDKAFSAKVPNLAFDAEGRPWVVFRSYESTRSGANVDIWAVHATDSSMREWTEPVRISSDEESARGGAGTSGAPAFVGEGLVIVFDIDGEMAGYSGDYRAVEEMRSETAGRFQGTHDYMLISDGERAHLAYHRPTESGQVMAYRYWTPGGGWSERLDVGDTGTHATAMAVDGDGNVWVFYGFKSAFGFRVLEKGETDFGPFRCAVVIPETRQAGSPWLSAAGGVGGEVGIAWMEKPGEFWEVRFRTLNLEAETGDGTCEG
jgi:hypothetical protein